MQLQYVSDLHLELRDNRDWFAANPVVPTGDILVIAGERLAAASEPTRPQVHFLHRPHDQGSGLLLGN